MYKKRKERGKTPLQLKYSKTEAYVYAAYHKSKALGYVSSCVDNMECHLFDILLELASNLLK